jgi:AraC family ethanolamine operon transcriptional activator
MQGRRSERDSIESSIQVLNSYHSRSQFSIEAHVAQDAWSHSMNVNSWSHVYEPVKPGPFHGLFKVAWLGPMQLIYERVDDAFNYRGHAWPGSRIFFSFLNGTANFLYDDRSVRADHVTTHRWDAVERVSCSSSLELVLIAIDEHYLAEYAGRTFGSELRVADGGPVSFAPEPLRVAMFQRCIIDVLRELGQAPTLLEDELARRAMQQNVLATLTEAVSADSSEQFRLPPPSTRAYVVRRAVNFIEGRIADPISIADICAEVRVCPRTLGYSFASVLGVSPNRYLLATRLNRARRDLATEGSHASIQSIAARWGFWHMGRFAQYYRQAFGERPSETCRLAARPAVQPVLRAMPGAHAAVNSEERVAHLERGRLNRVQ